MSGRSRQLCVALSTALLLAVAGCINPATVERQDRAKVAKAMFEERCKKAGVFIRRTAKDVEGVLIMKVRPGSINFGDQFQLDDPYGRDLGQDGYVFSFLRGAFQAPTSGTPPPGSPPRFGYQYVEAEDSATAKRYRYAGRLEEPWQKDKSYLKGYIKFVMDKMDAPGAAPRYGITYDDISTRQDREHWIAGSSLRVVEVATGEVLAERVGYMWDPGQGNRSGGRSPWLVAANYACPTFYRVPGVIPPGNASSYQSLQTLDFVERVLIPKP